MLKQTIGGFVAAIVTVCVAATANATTINAWSGKAVSYADNACFNEAAGAAYNDNCSTARNWEIPLPGTFATTGKVSVTVYVNNQAPGDICCDLYQVNATGAIQGGNPVCTYPASQGVTSIPLTTTSNYASGNTLYVACYVGNDSGVFSVTYPG